ncbi:MAG: hypothetical protein CM1200mP6_00860 [Anaerolineaceae bacterium]|nr:MAG: hypothetical protein CM1200mP6_00860 [Anaerolineaceae bacterium]
MQSQLLFQLQQNIRLIYGCKKQHPKHICSREKWSDALPYLERVINLTPDDTISIKETALVSSKSGDQQRAIELLHRASALDPDDASIHSDLSKLYQNSERWSEAKNALDQALALEPKNANFTKKWLIVFLCLETKKQH